MSAKTDQSKLLRGKIVRLFYIIFLILFFAYISSDFLDSSFHANQSLDLISNEIGQISTTNSIYFLHLLKEDPDLYERTKNEFLEIENLTEQMTNSIDDYKFDLINIEKVNKYGYFNNGKSESATNNFMIRQQKADTLIRKMKTYKMMISDYLSSEEAQYLDEILPLNRMIVRSDGQLQNIVDFYFHKTPLNSAVLNLSHFKSRIERIKNYALEKTIAKVIDQNPNLIPFDFFKLVDSEKVSDIYTASSLQEFVEKVDGEPSATTSKVVKSIDDLKYLYVESVTDTIHPLGEAVRFNARFEDELMDPVRVRVTSGDKVESYTLNKGSEFIYYPQTKGRYSFSFSSGNFRVEKRIKVIDVEPVIQNSKLSTLYIGIDNAVKVKVSEFDAADDLTAEITNGRVIRKGDYFYIRVKKKGINRLQVYANMPYGKIKVAEQSFIVRELQKPVAFVDGFSDGTTVTVDEIAKMKRMKVKTDEYLIDEDIFISGFEFMLIRGEDNTASISIVNTGASFNVGILDVLEKAEPGDILLFKNIKSKSSVGTERSLQTITLTVK
jgi:hypothetical protein